MRMILMSLLALSVTASAGDSLEGPQNLESGRTLYVVGYAHLDSQWRWTYQTTIDRFIKIRWKRILNCWKNIRSMYSISAVRRAL